LKINLSTTISMKRSRRELSIDKVIYSGTFKCNQITLCPVVLRSYLKQRLVGACAGAQPSKRFSLSHLKMDSKVTGRNDFQESLDAASRPELVQIPAY